MSPEDDLIQALQAALEVSPASPVLRKHLADLLMAKGDFQKAQQEYRRALDLAPQDSAIKLGLAESYLRQRRQDVAIVILEEMLLNQEPGARVYLLAARAYLQAGDAPRARQAYAQAIQKDPALADEALQQSLALRAQGQAGSEAPSPQERVPVPVQEAGEDLPAAIERPQLSFKDVGGMEKLKDEIRMKIIYPLAHPEIFQAYGKSVGGGILMYGPPGCGKTYLARATAGEVNARFLGIGIHDVLDMYLGQSEQNLHAIFELARANQPCVLFFDEVDALGASRSEMRHSAGRQVINQFLAELDGLGASNEGVLILAATNAPWHLDPALRRPGRFDRVIFVPPPDLAARSAILQILLSGKPSEKVEMQKLARETPGFSGADLKGVIDLAIEGKLRDALAKGALQPLTNRDLQSALKAVKPTTVDWFGTARNYALYSNQSGLYDEVLDYLKTPENSGLISRFRV